MSENLNKIPYPQEEQAMCATLVREIGRHTCWLDKVEAWHALLNVRMIAKNMRDEQELIHGVQACQSGVAAASDPWPTSGLCNG